MPRAVKNNRSRVKKLVVTIRRMWRERQRIDRTKRNFTKHGLLEIDGRSEYIECVQKYWRQHYGKAINPIWHVAIASVTGVRDERFIPQNIWFEEIIPYFNSMEKRHTYLDKNLAHTLIRPQAEVPSLVKRMHGTYYSNEGLPLPRADVESFLASNNGEVIIKGSGTDNGDGVRMATLSGGVMSVGGKVMGLLDVERLYGTDFAIQERLSQHPAMAAPHPESINTVRVVTLRWRGEIRTLLAFVRIGVGEKITDNAGTGGVCRGVGPDGQLSATAVDAYGKVYSVHPSSGFVFTDTERLPGYNRLCDYARELHERVFHFDLVSWDFVIGVDEQPIFLEMNFLGVSYVYQFACAKPIFGDLTPDILLEVGLQPRA